MDKDVVPITVTDIDGKIYIPVTSLAKYFYNESARVESEEKKELLRFLAEEMEALIKRVKNENTD